MDKARLEELRTMFDTLVDGIYCELFNSIRFKILEANETLDTLIDAELGRRVSDGEIQEAIDRLEKHDPMNESELSDDIQFAIAALRQYHTEPTDGEIQAAIDKLLKIQKLIVSDGTAKAIDLAIATLRLQAGKGRFTK